MFPINSLAIANVHLFTTAQHFSIQVLDFCLHGSKVLYLTYWPHWFLAKSYYVPTVWCAPLSTWQFLHGLSETTVSDEVYLSISALSFFPCCLSWRHLFFLTILFLSQIVTAGQALIRAFDEAYRFLLEVLHWLIQSPNNFHIPNAQILSKVPEQVYGVRRSTERL